MLHDLLLYQIDDHGHAQHDVVTGETHLAVTA
jgi:hypothetical protein